MDKKELKNDSKEPAWKKWTAIVGSVVAVSSLALNFVLGAKNYELHRDLQALQEHKMRADLEPRYLAVFGSAVFKIQQKESTAPNTYPLTRILQNQVYREFQKWLEPWGSGDRSIIEGEDSLQKSHGMTMLHIANRGGGNALKAILTIRYKDFSAQGEYAEDIWELDSSRWTEEKIRLADLRVDEKITIPLAHILGTNTYFGRVIVPVKLEWYNPILKKDESMPIQNMAPEEQWIIEGGNLIAPQ